MPDFIILDSLGPEIKVLVRLSMRAKRVGIRINHHGAELILPPGQYDKGYKFLLSKESWIRRKIRNIIPPESNENNRIPIFGKIYEVRHVKADHIRVHINPDIVEIHSKRSNHKIILIKFLQEKLLAEATEIVNAISIKHNLKFTKIRIMDNKTKWGTCSSRKELAFNWRLIFAPPEILKYLVVHEMCHLLEMNHNPRFWTLVQQLDANYKSAKLWLKQNGIKIQQYLQ